MLKKGDESPGTARQYCGATGKRDNCQSSAMIGIFGVNGYGLIDYRLCMPEIWFSAEYEERWDKCKIHDETKFATKNKLVSEMINSIYDKGIFRFKCAGVDSAFGHDPKFLDDLPNDVWRLSASIAMIVFLLPCQPYPC
jgi:SRSO17 transposase